MYSYGFAPSHRFDRPLAVWVASNCAKGRTELVKDLMELVPIHSFGKCLNNANWTEDEKAFGSAKIPLCMHMSLIHVVRSVTGDMHIFVCTCSTPARAYVISIRECGFFF